MKFSYGVTTVSTRRHTYLPKTLECLRQAGFESPILFVDGSKDSDSWGRQFKCETVVRSIQVHANHTEKRGPAGNCVLALHELFLREPYADRFILFQDDLMCYRNLKEYLEVSTKNMKGVYWNFYTFPPGRQAAPPDKSRYGWFDSNQYGRGGVGLMFDREGIMSLLSCRRLVSRPLDLHRGHRNIDGGILESMKLANFREVVHHPSLTQHTGSISSFGNKPHALAPDWLGENYDATKLLEHPRYDNLQRKLETPTPAG